MRKTHWLFLLTGLLAALLLVASAACGDDDDDDNGAPTATPTEAPNGTDGPSPTPGDDLDETQPGAAGIPSDPRDIEGFDGLWTIDDGLAMFAERDASEDRTGVTDSSVKICRSVPLTGQTAVYTETNAVIEEGIARVNAAGGIHGRQLEYVVRDDNGDPAQATQIVREFVENDGCFLMFNMVGTPANSAVVDYLAEEGVPSFMAGTSAVLAGEPGFPNLVSGVAPVLTAMFNFGNYIFEQNPDELVAIMYQDDDYGNSGLRGFQAAAEANGTELTAEIPFDIAAADISGQLTEAVNSGATAFVGLSFPTAWPKFLTGLRQTLGSDIKIFDPGGQAAQGAADLADDGLLDGIIGFGTSAKTITSDDPAIQIVNQIVRDAGHQPNQFAVNFGQVDIEHLARALACAGPDLTREGFIQAANGGCFDGTYTCSVCLAPSLITPQDRWLFETVEIYEYSNADGGFISTGDVVTGETAEGDGMRGNIEGFECSDELPCPWEEGCLPDATRCAWKEAFE